MSVGNEQDYDWSYDMTYYSPSKLAIVGEIIKIISDNCFTINLVTLVNKPFLSLNEIITFKLKNSYIQDKLFF